MNALEKYDTPELVQAEVISIDEVKKYIAPTATDKELFLFMNICKFYGLNPFKREIHFVKYGQNPGQTIVGYESYLKRAERTGKLNGWNVAIAGDNKTATVTIYRKDWEHPFIWAVDRAEFDKGQSTWKAMPRFMLKKVAIAQGFRLAFSEELGGMPYIQEEINGHTSEELPKTAPEATPATSKPPQKAPQAKQADGSTLTLCPEKVGQKSGGTAQKPWTRTFFKHGENWYSTFDTNMGAMLLEAFESGRQVEISYSIGEKGMDIETVVFVDEPTRQREPVEDMEEASF